MSGIVVGIDGSEGGRQALTWAVEEAEARSVDLQVVQSWHEPLVGSPAAAPSPEIEVLVQGAREGLDASARSVQAAHPDVAIFTTLADGRPARALLKYADDADLVVVGARGAGGFLGLEVGSVSSRVARKSPVPVIVVRGDPDRRGADEVVVGVDGSDCSRNALTWAADWARGHDKTLVALLAWNYLDQQGVHGSEAFRPNYGSADADTVLSTIVADVVGPDPGVRIVEETANDLPARALLERASDACLVVVGRHGSSHWAPPDIGATAQQVLHHATGTVAVIPDRPGPHDRTGD